MSSKAIAPAGRSGLDQAQGRRQAAYRSMRALAAAAIAVVVTFSVRSPQAPGGHGQALGVTAALIAFCATTAEGARLLAGEGDADPRLGNAIERAHRLGRTGLEEARRAIGMLRGDALPGPERLADLAAEFESDSGVACTVAVSGAERDLGTEGRLTLYRVAQEALTNIRKHARADRVEIRLAYEPSGTRLAIEDLQRSGELTGPGDGSGYGLTGMRERAELLGGTLAAGSTGTGFLVELWVPA